MNTAKRHNAKVEHHVSFVPRGGAKTSHDQTHSLLMPVTTRAAVGTWHMANCR